MSLIVHSKITERGEREQRYARIKKRDKVRTRNEKGRIKQSIRNLKKG